MDNTLINSPLVTVLMPVYNAEPFLGDAINSILNQTYTHFELLIINDGSIDDSSGIVNSFNDPRIRYIENAKNEGLISVLNQGIDLAKGEFIARMDADDVSLPERLQKQVNTMLSDPATAVCGTFYETFGNSNTRTVTFPCEQEEVGTELIFSCCLAHPSVMIRKSFLFNHNLSYDKAYNHAEDYKLWIDIAKFGNLVNLPEVLLSYREHPNQVTKIFSDIQLKNSDRIKLEKLYEHLDFLEQDEERIFLNLVNNLPLTTLDKVEKLIILLKTNCKKVSHTYLSIRLKVLFENYSRHRAQAFYFRTDKKNRDTFFKFHSEYGLLNKYMISKGYVYFLFKSFFF